MIVTLLTDFGLSDPYVGIMKGVLLAAEPGLTLVDLTHDLRPGDVASGAYALLTAYRYFPVGTVHLAVIDPGVGTERRALAVEAAGQRFVAPDNGLLSYLLEEEGEARVVEVKDQPFFRQPRSSTFHGRDLFAPTAAALAGGAALEEMGPRVADPVRLPPLRPLAHPDGSLQGRVLAVDRFGNCITSLPSMLVPGAGSSWLRLELAGAVIEQMQPTFGAGESGALFVVRGSAGFLEVVMNGASAAERLGVEVGDPVILRSGG